MSLYFFLGCTPYYESAWFVFARLCLTPCRLFINAFYLFNSFSVLGVTSLLKGCWSLLSGLNEPLTFWASEEDDIDYKQWSAINGHFKVPTEEIKKPDWSKLSIAERYDSCWKNGFNKPLIRNKINTLTFERLMTNSQYDFENELKPLKRNSAILRNLLALNDAKYPYLPSIFKKK